MPTLGPVNAPSPVEATPERRPWPEHWEALLERWLEDEPIAAEVMLRLPPPVLGAGSREECLGAVADALGETLPDKRALVDRAVQLLGWRAVLELLVRALELDDAGGLWSVATKSRRTRGGVFFALMPRKRRWLLEPCLRRPRAPGAAEPAPPLPAPTKNDIAAAHAKKGTITVTPKMTLMGRPALDGVVARATYVSFTLDYKGAPSLPKGLPTVPTGPTTYTVYLAAKKWPALEHQLRVTPTDQLLLEGFVAFDADVEGPALWVESATTQALKRAKFAAKEPPATPPPMQAWASKGGVRKGEMLVTDPPSKSGGGPEVVVRRRAPT